MTAKSNARSANEVDAYVGQRLKQLRRDQNLSQTELGRAVGVTFQQIQKYEKGQNRMSMSRIWKLCQFFEVTPNFFLQDLLERSACELKAK